MLSKEIIGLLFVCGAALLIAAICLWFKYLRYKQLYQDRLHAERLYAIQLAERSRTIETLQRQLMDAGESATELPAARVEIEQLKEELRLQVDLRSALYDEYEWFRTLVRCSSPGLAAELERKARVEVSGKLETGSGRQEPDRHA